MSRKNKDAGIINILREKLEKENQKRLNEGGEITPYHIIEALKTSVADGDELTYIGRLIKESLGDPEDIETVNWIAFHCDFPGQEFSYSERDTRNWIAVKNDKQELLDVIHKHVREKYYEIQNIYAPSVVLAQISRLYHRDKKLIKNFQERRWLYRLNNSDNIRPRPCLLNDDCHNKTPEDMDMICFQ